ncbi:MAG: DNA-methyltransferase [Candidatus Lutacidiplasmatales archaeon]
MSAVGLDRHRDLFYLCDRSYVGGKRRHWVLEAYGRHRPTLYPPQVRSGIAADLLSQLPSESFSLVYLDPPYGTTDGDWDRAPDWKELGRAVARLLKPTGQVVLHGSGSMGCEAVASFLGPLRYRFEIVWVKTSENGCLMPTSWITDFEPLRAFEQIHVMAKSGSKTTELTFNRGAIHRRVPAGPRSAQKRPPSHQLKGGWSGRLRPRRDGYGFPVNVIFQAPARTGDLYAAKPEDLTRQLVSALTKPGDWILDPFAGSGTTLRVAYRLGRRSLGIEASPVNFALLKRRLSELGQGS